MSDNVSLSIKSGESLSYVIDKCLDEELGVDVKLNLNEWNSVFTKIKENQVTTNKNQFTDSDTDIRNGKHYRVDANSTYEIKQDVWSEIVKIAKQRFGGKTKAQETVKAETPAPASDSRSDAQKKLDADMAEVKKYLSDTSIDYDNEPKELQMDLVRKYRAIKDINNDNDEQTLKTRLENYAKGWKYHNFELKAVNFKNPKEFQSDCRATQEIADKMNAEYEKNKNYDIDNDGKITAEEILKTKYMQFAKEYIEYYDLNELGTIDTGEMLLQAAQDFYRTQQGQGNNLSKKDAYKKALDLVTAYQNKTLMPNEDGTADEKLLAAIVNKIDYFDIGTETNDDGELSVDEVAAMLLATAQLHDSKNNISKEEVIDMNAAVSSKSVHIQNRKVETAYRFLNE